MQKLGENHYAPTVEAVLRFLLIRLRSRPACAALADEAKAVRLDVRAKRDAWDDAVDEARAATADVGYKDTRIDDAVKVELKAEVASFVATLPKAQRESTMAKIFGAKSPADGMRPVGGPAQAHYVDLILAQLGTPGFSALSAVTAKISTLRTELIAAEADRKQRRIEEQLARSTLEDACDAARRFYNQMHARLELLFPDDLDFVESCFLDIRGVSLDQGAEARKRVLLMVYRARIGPVPREVQAAVEGTDDDAAFGKLVELFATKAAEEIAAAVVPKKPG
jgi:hypothetical protein